MGSCLRWYAVVVFVAGCWASNEPEYSVGEEHLASGAMIALGCQSSILSLQNRFRNSSEITMVVVGGSITAGHSVGNQNWFDLFSTWLTQKLSPSIAIKSSNLALHGCGPSYCEKCVLSKIADDVDIVFLEFAVTDWDYQGEIDTGERRAFERIIRSLLSRAVPPVVMIMMFHPHGKIAGQYFNTTEDRQLIIAQYYGLPVFSGRAAFYTLYAHNETLRRAIYLPDDFHPDALGHRWHGDLVKYFFMQTVLPHIMRSPEKQLPPLPLPPPMFTDNEVAMRGICVMGPDFKGLATNKRGFQWSGSGHRLPGYEGTSPGSQLLLHLSISQAVLEKMQQSPLLLLVSHLVSYAHMGVAQFQCQQPCSCYAEVDGHINDRVSVPWFYKIPVHMNNRTSCDVLVTIMKATKSGENKFKIFGLVVEYGNLTDNVFGWFNFVSQFSNADQGGDQGFEPTTTSLGTAVIVVGICILVVMLVLLAAFSSRRFRDRLNRTFRFK